MTSLAVRNGHDELVEDPQRLGRLLAESGYFSDARQAAQAAVKVLAGRELGFPPIASMTGIYIVKGRVTLSANLMAAAIKRYVRADGTRPYRFKVTEHTAERCVIEFIEDGETVGVSSFSMDDAKAAGLANSETYKKFPMNMLYARALSNGAKWYCPDVFGGPIYTPDELGATVDEEGQISEPAALAPAAAPVAFPAGPDSSADETPATPTLSEDRAQDIYEDAVAVGVERMLQLAASHAHGSDVGDCSTRDAAVAALCKLTVPQGEKVEAWLHRKADEQAAKDTEREAADDA